MTDDINGSLTNGYLEPCAVFHLCPLCGPEPPAVVVVVVVVVVVSILFHIKKNTLKTNTAQ